MRRIFALLALGFIPSAEATSFSTDLSDLWFNPASSGEGFNVIQQGDTLFITFFVYDSSNRPIWYVAPATSYTGSTGNNLNFQGALYVTAGPPSPSGAAGGARQVGSATFIGTSVTNATLTYTVDGASFQKTLTRQTWRNDDSNGQYIGASVGTYSNCATGNGYAVETATYVVSQSGGILTLAATYQGRSCTYSGTYTQAGRMGAVTGTAVCSTAPTLIGTLNAFEIQVTPSGFTGRANVAYGACAWTGHFGGLRLSP